MFWFDDTLTGWMFFLISWQISIKSDSCTLSPSNRWTTPAVAMVSKSWNRKVSQTFHSWKENKWVVNIPTRSIIWTGEKWLYSLTHCNQRRDNISISPTFSLAFAYGGNKDVIVISLCSLSQLVNSISQKPTAIITIATNYSKIL